MVCRHAVARTVATGAWPYNRPCAHQYVGKYQSCMVENGRLIVHASYSGAQEGFTLVGALEVDDESALSVARSPSESSGRGSVLRLTMVQVRHSSSYHHITMHLARFYLRLRVPYWMDGITRLTRSMRRMRLTVVSELGPNQGLHRPQANPRLSPGPTHPPLDPAPPPAPPRRRRRRGRGWWCQMTMGYV